MEDTPTYDVTPHLVREHVIELDDDTKVELGIFPSDLHIRARVRRRLDHWIQGSHSMAGLRLSSATYCPLDVRDPELSVLLFLALELTIQHREANA